jgi:hypothetical protein
VIEDVSSTAALMALSLADVQWQVLLRLLRLFAQRYVV